MLAIGGGMYFEIGAGNYCYLTIEDGQSVEIVRYHCTGPVSNDSITVVRGQDGTSSKAFPAGACVKVAWNVAQVTELTEQTFVNIFNSTTLPPNTMQVGAPPTAPPPNHIIYAVWVEHKRIWVWNLLVWTELGNTRDAVLVGHADPSGTPLTNVAFYINLDNGALWYWTGLAWLRVGGETGSVEEYWVRSSYYAGGGPLGIISANTMFELGNISPTLFVNRFRTYPHGVPGDSAMAFEERDGMQRMVLQRDAAIEVNVTVRGFFSPAPTPAPDDAVMQLLITNSYNDEWFADSATLTAAYQPSLPLTVATGVMTYPAGTYFDGNVHYTAGATTPNFTLDLVIIGFHVVNTDPVLIGIP